MALTTKVTSRWRCVDVIPRQNSTEIRLQIDQSSEKPTKSDLHAAGEAYGQMSVTVTAPELRGWFESGKAYEMEITAAKEKKE